MVLKKILWNKYFSFIIKIVKLYYFLIAFIISNVLPDNIYNFFQFFLDINFSFLISYFYYKILLPPTYLIFNPNLRDKTQSC